MKLPDSRLLRLSVRLGVLLLLGLCLTLGVSARPAHAQSALTVSDCSSDSQLQADVAQANSDNANDTITFSCSGDILLSSTLTISGSMTLDGSGQSVTLDGGGSVQVLVVNSGIDLTLNALTIAHGSTTYYSGGLTNYGTVSISNSTIANNSTSNDIGGGLGNEGTATISNSTIANNSGYRGGGGLENQGTLSISNSTFASNSTSIEGGGLFNSGSGTVSISNSTFASNSATYYGGGLFNSGSGTVSINNSTFASNSAIEGGGLFNVNTITISGSIVAENPGGDCANDGTITDQGYNLDSDSSCFTASTSLHTNPQLSSLADNGGPTQTMALQQGSPAIDAIPLSANVCPSTDQRGDPRPDADTPAETACDIGAYESNYPPVVDNDLGLSNMPANITTNATSPQGATVTYTSPSATDESGDTSSATVTCTPASGSTFAVGKTTVTCTATDSDDTNSPVSQSFTVNVKPVLTLKMPSTMKTVEGSVFTLVNVGGTAYGTVNPLTVTITWGDGSNAQVINVTPAADGSYSVSASYTYAEEGSYSLTVTVADHSRLSVTRTTTVKVADAALKFTSLSKSVSGLTLTMSSVFTDADPNGTLSDYSASINWGDGNTTGATVAVNSNGSGFTTQGSHTYATAGTYSVTLTVTDAGGSQISKTVSVTLK